MTAAGEEWKGSRSEWATALALEPRELVWLGFEPGGGRVGNRRFVAVGGNRLPNGRR